jgi:hypothetical protein
MVKISPDELSHPQSRAIGAHRCVQLGFEDQDGGQRSTSAQPDIGIFDFGAHAKMWHGSITGRL